jgi:hypothetical protein
MEYEYDKKNAWLASTLKRKQFLILPRNHENAILISNNIAQSTKLAIRALFINARL